MSKFNKVALAFLIESFILGLFVVKGLLYVIKNYFYVNFITVSDFGHIWVLCSLGLFFLQYYLFFDFFRKVEAQDREKELDKELGDTDDWS